MALRERRREELKNRIFETSMRLFMEQGYENTTINQIASACNMAKGTFFNYFPKKESVLTYFGEMQYKRVKELAAKMLEQQLPADEILRKLFRNLLEKTQENPTITKTLILEALKSSVFDDEYSNQISLTQMFAEVVKYGQERAIFKSTNLPLEVAENIIALYFYTCFQWVSDSKRNIYQRWDRTLNSYLYGIMS